MLHVRNFLLWATIISFISNTATVIASSNHYHRRHFHNNNANANNDKNDPYKILGVTKDSTQDEIKRSYRKLCLKYHPDKNVNLNDKDRTKYEEQFKHIQKAYSLIGTKESRDKFDNEINYFGRNYDPTTSSSSQQPSYNDWESFYSSAAEELFRKRYYRRPTRRRRFYVNGIDISQFFPAPSYYSNSFGGMSTASSGQPSMIYVEKITIPIEDLYSGNTVLHDMTINDNLWKRYRALFRGKVLIMPIIGQALSVCVPLLFRVKVSLVFIIFCVMFHLSIPESLSKEQNYGPLPIKKGWKGGTKIIYKNNPLPGYEIRFIIQEGKHPTYKRSGNNLLTSITISPKQQRKGCTTYIEPLCFDSNEEEEENQSTMKIKVKLKSNEIKYSGQTIIIKGKGWPIRNKNDTTSTAGNSEKRQKEHESYGDLVITVNIERKGLLQGKQLLTQLIKKWASTSTTQR